MCDAHVTSVDESETLEFPWGRIRWLVNGAKVRGANITVGWVEIEPGMKNPLHLHPNSEEVLVLMEGELDHSIGDEVHRLTRGSAIVVPANTPHDGRNVGSVTARMVVSYPTGDRQMVVLEESNA
jgi:quercetin dioxygenase-like cupin family protein